MVKYLLDSDIAITILRDKKDSTGLRQKVLSVGIGNCFMSEIALAELSSGAHKMASERGLHEVEFLKTIFGIIPFGGDKGASADIFGSTKALLESIGKPIDDMDLLIGSTAVASGLTLVTHNTRHFSRIPKITLEDWLG